MDYKTVHIHSDGGSRGNPGPSAIGVVIEIASKIGELQHFAEFGKQISPGTNNEAEYKAVLAAFSYLITKAVKSREVVVYLDSQVVARQLSGAYKINQLHLKQLHAQVKDLEKSISETIKYIAIPREDNSRADFLLNQALDAS